MNPRIVPGETAQLFINRARARVEHRRPDVDPEIDAARYREHGAHDLDNALRRWSRPANPKCTGFFVGRSPGPGFRVTPLWLSPRRLTAILSFGDPSATSIR